MDSNHKSMSYKDLIVWQKAMDFVVLIYKITEDFPQKELYGLTSQIRRAAVSIPSNVAEGSKRSSKKDFCNFLRTSLGSAAEIETQIDIAHRIEYFSDKDYDNLGLCLTEIQKMLFALIRKFRNETDPKNYKL